ncbi:MAG: hypothetical protein WKG07_27565 [Hymenobacter sp.]
MRWSSRCKEKPFSPRITPTTASRSAAASGARPPSDGDQEASAHLRASRKPPAKARTDAAGRGTATYAVPDYRDLGTLEGAAFATVFDESGRPVNRLATFDVQTQATMFGIQHLPELVSTRQAVTVQLLALTPPGPADHGAAAEVQSGAPALGNRA